MELISWKYFKLEILSWEPSKVRNIKIRRKTVIRLEISLLSWKHFQSFQSEIGKLNCEQKIRLKTKNVSWLTIMFPNDDDTLKLRVSKFKMCFQLFDCAFKQIFFPSYGISNLSTQIQVNI